MDIFHINILYTHVIIRPFVASRDSKRSSDHIYLKESTLKIESQSRDDHQVKLVVEFENEIFEAAKHQAARKLAGRIKIPGFRPGKAPYAIVLRQVGEPALAEEAIEIIIKEQYPKIIEESGIHPYSFGQLENIQKTDPLTLEFAVPLDPEVKLGDYSSMHRPYEPKPVGEDEIEEVLDNLRDRHAVLEPVDRTAGEGDVVTVNLAGERLNPDEGQDATLIPKNSYQFLVRPTAKPNEDEWPFPGFSSYLIGMAAGDETNITHIFPEDYLYESLRDATARYSLKVEDVKSRQVPELDDDFAKTIGEYVDLAALISDIRQGLEQQATQDYNDQYDEAVFEELIAQSTIKYPPQMLELEQNNIIDNLKHRLEQQGTDFDLYLKTRNLDLDGLKEEARPVAEKRIERSLILLEISRLENIQVSEEELQTETVHMLQSLNQSLSPEEARRLTDKRIMDNLVGNVMLDLLQKQSLERLRGIVSGSYHPEETVEPAVEAALVGEIETKDEVRVEEVVDETIQTVESEESNQDIRVAPSETTVGDA